MKKALLLMGGLLLLDQIAKIGIVHMNVGHIPILYSYLSISVKHNTQMSMVNSLFGFSFYPILLIVFNAAVIFWGTVCMMYARKKGVLQRAAAIGAAGFFMAGTCAALLDKVAWGGSYDWLCVDIPFLPARYFFDLKDIFLDISVLLLLICLVAAKRSARWLYGHDRDTLTK